MKYKKFLLYIDILGFSNLVKTNQIQVRRIYKIIEHLNAHHHESFKVIIFSDTVLVYNINYALSDEEKCYYVMFLIEFVQDLFYHFAGKNIYYRAVIVEDDFTYYKDGRFEKYFGKALIHAYESEKMIKCTGLFIDKRINKYNNVFNTEKYDKKYLFVFVNQVLDRVEEGEIDPLPVNKYDIENIDIQWDLAKDVYFLRDVYKNMSTHFDEKVKIKMAATWNLYKKRYPKFINYIELNKFDLTSISDKSVWIQPLARISEGFKGFSDTVPTVKEIITLMGNAKEIGFNAAEIKMNQIGRDKFSPCGGTLILIDMDGRSKLKKQLEKASEQSGLFSIYYCNSRKQYILSIKDMCRYQPQIAEQTACEAIKILLEDGLNVIITFETFYD